MWIELTIKLVILRIRSERRGTQWKKLLRTSDFILFWALKALSQLAELIGRTRRIWTRWRMFYESSPCRVASAAVSGTGPGWTWHEDH